MGNMFYRCSFLKSLYLNPFNNYRHRSLNSLVVNNFDTSKVTDMSNMFYGCSSLTSLNLNNFNTSKVTYMEYMFYNCSSLISLDLGFDIISHQIIFNMFHGCNSLFLLNLENAKIFNIYQFFKETSLNYTPLKYFNFGYLMSPLDEQAIYYFKDEKNITFCINNQSNLDKNLSNFNIINCSNICFSKYKKIINQKKICVLNCLDDDLYKYEYNGFCYDECPNGLFSSNYLCAINDTIEKPDIISNENITYNKDLLPNFNLNNFFKGIYKIINQTSEVKDEIINVIKNAILKGNFKFNSIISGESNSLLIKDENIAYEITSTNDNNDENNNSSAINLGNCENILKDVYDIDENLPLILFKVEYFVEGLLIPVIGYEVFHPLNNSQLNLSYCRNETTNLSIPVTINEEKLFIYDPNSEYYNDDCYPYTTESGTDILINDRQNEFVNNNMSLCENNCEYYGYDESTKKVVCKCGIKYSQIVISKVDNDSNILSNNFTNQTTSLNTGTMKCYYTLFTVDGLSKNYESYILMFIIILFIIFGLIFYKCGYPTINYKIRDIVQTKEENEKNININETIDKKNMEKYEQNDILKIKNNRVNPILLDSNNNNSKSFSKLDLQKNKNVDFNNLAINYQNKEKSITFNDYELNSLYYKKALQYDKRSFLQYYVSLLRAKHPFLFGFCPLDDYNSKVVKKSIFLLFFSMIYTINGFFFLNKSMIHKIYIDGGKYSFELQILYSFILSHIFYLLIQYIFLSEKSILEIKNEETSDKAADKVDDVRRCLIIKYIIFYIIGTLLLIFCWYYLSSFGAVFQNSQIFLIKNSLISLGISFIYPFIINIIPGLLRNFSLTNGDKEWLYKISQLIQFM